MQRLEMSEATHGDGYAVSHLDAMGEGYGFRKVRHELGAGGMARVDPSTPRGMRNVGQDAAIVVVAGGKDGYVGRDGQAVGDNPRGGPAGDS
jgi:hypothetical protein